MHILITADGRSPIAINWIRMVLDAGHMVTLVTTYPCQEIPGVEHIIPLHVAFGSLAGGGSSPSSALRRLVRRFRPLFQAARNTFAPLGMERAGRQFSRLVEQVKPDIVHALRIPYEGILASHTPPGIPLVVNIWGNDFTLHANSSRMLGRLTTGTLRRADALMADTRRDLRLAVRWGFDSTKPALALPSAGGIDLEQVGAAVSLPFRSAGSVCKDSKRHPLGCQSARYSGIYPDGCIFPVHSIGVEPLAKRPFSLPGNGKSQGG